MLTFTELCRTWGIGLTGGIATGKSTVAKILTEKSYLVLDADRLSRDILAPGTPALAEVVAVLGREFILTDGSLNRSLLRKHIFSVPEARLTLEAIVHPRLELATISSLQEAQLFQNPGFWFYEASLLYERKREQDFRAIWVANCPRDVQIQRLLARDHGTIQDAEAILRAQMPTDEKAKRADVVIDTNCEWKELVVRVEHAIARLTEA